MDNAYLKHLADNTTLNTLYTTDTNAPLSFLEWRAQSAAVPEVDDYNRYNQYVLNWFSNNANKPVSNQFVLRQKYLYLLQQLQVFFTEEEKNIWYNQINFADEKELLTAIPYFAKKLRDIAIYYLNLRKQLKTTKLKYNTVGTNAAIEREIYSNILNAFSPNNVEHAPEIRTLVPSFSSLQQSLAVTIEELYDGNQYFDWSPTAPLSGYVNILDTATASFFQTKGIVLSSDNWVFETFNLPVTGDINTLVNRLTGNVFETTDVNLYGNFIQKYLSENKYTFTYTAAPSSYIINNVPLSGGNNRFYYPQGLVDNTLTIDGQLTPVALSSIQMDGAASGTTLNQSDSMFVRYGDTIKGAWYRYIDYTNTTKEMDVHLAHNATTEFIYPFPGYGLSAVDSSWTGVSLVSNPEYPFLSKSIKKAIQQQYWSTSLSSNNCLPLYLNNTNIVNSGANSNKEFSKADKIYLRNNNQSPTSPVGELSGAWLYKFTKTALPVTPNQTNIILWPYDIIDTTNNTLSAQFQNQNYQDVCSPVSINDIDTSYFTAASAIGLADVIYKLGYYTDNEQANALECAWLQSSIVTKNKHSFAKQDGLNMSLSAGQVTRFVWTGPDQTPVSEVFSSVLHQTDCPFVTNNPTVSAYEWQKCSCKQVHYSPLGHPGNAFTEYNEMADFVVLDTRTTTQSGFDLGSWRDLSGKTVSNSDEFCWYYSDKPTWGYGKWVTSGGGYMTLKQGASYFYGRANSRLATNLPPYNILYSFNTSNTQWIQGIPNADGTAWISSGIPSTMQINPGDYIKVVKQTQTTYYDLSSQLVANTSSNKGSVWATYDSVVVSTPTFITWPNTTIQVLGDQNPSQSLTTLTRASA